ncbi:MAG: thiol:disulfide interchange protein DsbA/DsbL [Steroidobacteraceae bacterium]
MRILKLLATALLVGSIAPAMAAAPVEGKDYVRLTTPPAAVAQQKVVVTEFFSYQCPHCYSFAKPFAAWQRALPADVIVERVPVAFGRPAWEPSARAYLALSQMKLLAKTDDALFDAIHRQGIRLDTDDSMIRWAATQGIDGKLFEAQYRSFGVATQMKSADLKSRTYQIPSIPAVVVDGRYLVAIVDNGGFKSQLAVVDELINRARKEKPRTP